MCTNSQSNVSTGSSTEPLSPASLPVHNQSSNRMRFARSNDDLMALQQEVEREMELNSDAPEAAKYEYHLWGKLTPRQQFLALTITMFLFFGVHNILQEAMMKVPGFNGIMLSYMEVVGCVLHMQSFSKHILKLVTLGPFVFISRLTHTYCFLLRYHSFAWIKQSHTLLLY